MKKNKKKTIRKVQNRGVRGLLERVATGSHRQVGPPMDQRLLSSSWLGQVQKTFSALGIDRVLRTRDSGGPWLDPARQLEEIYNSSRFALSLLPKLWITSLSHCDSAEALFFHWRECF